MHSHNFDHNYLLYNLATSIYIFYNKNRFTNFKKATKNQKILYNINTIIIKDWGKISLLLRMKN